jgi:hypothetical protein
MFTSILYYNFMDSPIRTAEDILRCESCLTGYFIGDSHTCPLPIREKKIENKEGDMSYCASCECLFMKPHNARHNKLCWNCRKAIIREAIEKTENKKARS